MHFRRVALLLVLLFLFPLYQFAKQVPAPQQPSVTPSPQSPVHDPQAVTILENALKAFGGVIPSATVATGNVTIFESTGTESGTIKVLMRGTQSLEEIQTDSDQRIAVFSKGVSSETRNGVSIQLPSQETVNRQCPDLLQPYIAWALNNPMMSLKYLGDEAIGTATAHHVLVWNTFATAPPWQQALASYTERDIWFDGSTGLPIKVTYLVYVDALKARVPLNIFYSNYEESSGVTYASTVEKRITDSPWITIKFSGLLTNTALVDSDFPVFMRKAQ